MMETGTATPGMMVPRTFLRKANTTRITRMAEITRVNSTSFSDPRMDGLRSTTTETSMPRGISAVSCGSKARMLSTVLMILAPGDLKMTTITQILPLTSPSTRRSSWEFPTEPTSTRCIGAWPW